MNITREELRQAGRRAELSERQTDRLWQELAGASEASVRARFDATQVAYYFGAMIVIAAMGWLMTKAWEGLGGAGIFGVAACYAVCFVLGGRTLWAQPRQRVAGGLLLTMAVAMVPLAIYGLERWTGFWPAEAPAAYRDFHPYINGSWILMELGTVLAGLWALRCWRFPFLTAPIAVALWYFTMDAVALIARQTELGDEERKFLSMVLGLAMLLAAYGADLRAKAEDLAFWLYLFGLAAFWGGLSAMNSDSELGKAGYALINLGLMGVALVLRRRAFLVFGAIGFFGYLGHLAYRVFADSIWFPFALTLLGLGIIALGLQYQKRRDDWGRRFRRTLLPQIGGLIPARARRE